MTSFILVSREVGSFVSARKRKSGKKISGPESTAAGVLTLRPQKTEWRAADWGQGLFEPRNLEPVTIRPRLRLMAH
jgi:hypothetical protein